MAHSVKSESLQGKSAKDVMELLPRVTSEKTPDSDDFYSYKYTSIENVIPEIKIDGDWAQFGVYKGNIAKEILKSLPDNANLHLLDSFEGLPEDWIGVWKAGAFQLTSEEIPAFDDQRVKIHKGWFSDTVPLMADHQEKQLAFMHIDCDLYSSTIDCLFGMNKFIVTGTVLLFDEYVMLNNGEFDDGEHRAVVEWMEKFDRQIEYLWRTNWVQVAARVIK